MNRWPESPGDGEVSILAGMGKPKVRSVLYRLIEAGQLTRKALLVPLVERGLEPGDDAILFLLHEQMGAREPELAEALGLDAASFEMRVARLRERGLIEARAVGPDLASGLALTERGERICEILIANWSGLEEALLGELPRKEQKALRKTLGRFVELLKL
jgi:DNA-binding MarR family transcriptional regulator